MQDNIVIIPQGRKEPEQPGEWLEERNQFGGVRRYKKTPFGIEYEPEVMIGGIPVPQSQVEEHNRRMKEAAEQQRQRANQEAAASAPLNTVCPFLYGRGQLHPECRRDCVFYGQNGCEFRITSTEPATDTTGRKCPIKGKCDNKCTMYSNGCGLLEFMKYIKTGRNMK